MSRGAIERKRRSQCGNEQRQRRRQDHSRQADNRLSDDFDCTTASQSGSRNGRKWTKMEWMRMLASG